MATLRDLIVSGPTRLVGKIFANDNTLVTNLNADMLDGRHGSEYALASALDSYLPLAGGRMTGAGPIEFTEGKLALEFRPNNASYYSRVQYMTAGNEALVFSNANSVTSFIFKNGHTLANGTGWNTVFSTTNRPSVQIKGQSLYVNEFINSGVTPSYNFFVNGTSWFKGNVTIDSSSIGGADHLVFNRASSYSYIRVPSSGGLCLIAADSVSAAGTQLIVNSSSIASGTTKTVNLGTSSSFWKELFTQQINVNNRLTIDSTGRGYPYSSATRNAGMYGVYDSQLLGHVWSMGTGYLISDDGKNPNGLYGMAYFHTNWSNDASYNTNYASKTPLGTYAGGHQIGFFNSGVLGTSIGMAGGIWTKGSPGLTIHTPAGTWSYINFRSGSTQWHVGTCSSAGYVDASCFEIRSYANSYAGIQVRYNTSAYGRLVISSPSGEVSLGFRNATSGNPKWVLGTIDSTNFRFGLYSTTIAKWIGNFDTSGNLYLGEGTGRPTYNEKLVTSGNTLSDGYGTNDGYFIVTPKGGRYYIGASSATGYIRIGIPSGMAAMMCSIWIDVYNYSTNTSFTVHCGGYTYTGSHNWINIFSEVFNAAHKVRFAADASNNFAIYIGESNTNWSHVHIVIRDVLTGFSRNYTNVLNAWSITVVTSIAEANVSAAQANGLSSNGGFHDKTLGTQGAGNAYVLLGGGGHLALTSLGTLGVQGTQGTQGAQGTRGTQGAAGTNGVQGTNGVVGTQGAKGTQGDKGTQGNAGTQGAAGTRGVQGTQGAKGTQGNAGTQGAAGTRGAVGTQGAAGTKGVIGTQGVKGTQGVQGVQGTQGLSGSSKNLTLKNTSGTSVTYNGSAAVDLSGGTYYATRSFGITSGGNNLTGGTTGQVLVKINNTNGNWQWSTLSSFGTLTVRSNATNASFTVSYSVASGITQTTTIAANGSGSVPSGVTLSIAIPTALTNNGYTGANPYTYTMTGTSATIDLNYPQIQTVTASGTTTVSVPTGFSKLSAFIVNGGNGGTYSSTHSSGGLGGKTTTITNVAVTAGSSITCYVGAGGTKGNDFANSATYGGRSYVRIGSTTYQPSAQTVNENVVTSNNKAYYGKNGTANPFGGDSSLYGAEGSAYKSGSFDLSSARGTSTTGGGYYWSGGGLYNMPSAPDFYGGGGCGGCATWSTYMTDGYQGIIILKFHN